MWLVFFLSEKKEIGTFRNGELDDVRCLPCDVEDVDARTRSIDRFLENCSFIFFVGNRL